MKYLLILILSLIATIGCYKVVEQPEPQVQSQPESQPAEPQAKAPSVPHSTSWIRGYNDGYNGNWVGPVNWLGSNEYRAGWSAGNKDSKAGKPHRLDP